jgi:predicted Zn-dependent peptidase
MSRAIYTWQSLPQGPRLAVATIEGSECAAINVLIPAGSRDDPDSLNGLAHFSEHMAFKGTQRRDARELSLLVENGGGQINACTTEDQTIYEGRGDAELLPILADAVCDMVWNSTFPAAEIRTERDVIHEEITMYRESPSDHIGDLISSALWPNHPLGRPVSGTASSIRRIQRRSLLDFRDAQHFRQDVIIAVSGPFSLLETLETILPHVPECRLPTPEPPPFFRENHPPKDVVEHRDTDQLQLALAWHTPGRRSESRHALRLLSLMLGETASSRLFLDLREASGLCYHVSSDVTFFDDTGAFEIHAGLDPQSQQQAEERIHAQLADLARNGPTAIELDRTKRLAVTQAKQAFETTSAHVGWAAECLLDFGYIPDPVQWRSHLLGVTPEDIIQAAEQLVSSPYARARILPA